MGKGARKTKVLHGEMGIHLLTQRSSGAGGNQLQNHELVPYDEMGMENSDGPRGLWLLVFRNKYLTREGLDIPQNIKSSQFANTMMKVKHLLILDTKFEIHNGKLAKLWSDRWCGDQVLGEYFPRLFAISEKPITTTSGSGEMGRGLPALEGRLGNRRPRSGMGCRKP